MAEREERPADGTSGDGRPIVMVEGWLPVRGVAWLRHLGAWGASWRKRPI